jgi:hypothetical protein
MGEAGARGGPPIFFATFSAAVPLTEELEADVWPRRAVLLHPEGRREA